MPHTTFARGSHVFVILRDGTSFDDRYIEKKTRTVVLKERGEVAIRTIRTMSYFKGK
jgi:hypothetical protein